MSQIMLFSCPSYLIYNHGWRLSKSGIFEAMLVCNIMCSEDCLKNKFWHCKLICVIAGCIMELVCCFKLFMDIQQSL